MVKQIQIVTFAIIVIAVTAFNVSAAVNSNRSHDLNMTTIAAISGEGGDFDGEGGDIGGESDGNISLICRTISEDIYYERADCMVCGRKHLVAKWDTKGCNDGVYSFCYPGYIRTYYDCNENITEVFDNTSISSCNFIN